jgi:hypothetical protein
MENKDKVRRWKFFHNGDGWWLKITTYDEILDYVKAVDNRYGDALLELVDHESKGIQGHYSNQLSYAIDQIARMDETSRMSACVKLSMLAGEAYINHLRNDGFVNINKVGGCNSIDWKEELVEYKDNLCFPDYSEKNIRVKTFENIEAKYGEIKENYNYHWYAYIGEMQIKDGSKEKWDTKEEAMEFAKKYVQ